MFFKGEDANKIDIDVGCMSNILKSISDKPKNQKEDILLEMTKEVRTFREAMTLMSAVIDNEIQTLYKESFKVALKYAASSKDILELYELIRENNLNEGKKVRNLFIEKLEIEIKSTESMSEKVKIFINVISKMRKDDDLVELMFPRLRLMSEGLKNFEIWNSIYKCAIQHQYGLEAMEAVEKMLELRSDFKETVILCSYVTTSFNVSRVLQLNCEIGANIDVTSEDESEKVSKWIQALEVSPSGSYMELYAVGNLAPKINTFDDVRKALRVAKSAKARRAFMRRAVEIAGEDIKNNQHLAIWARNDPEIFEMALGKIMAAPDSFEKYYALFGLGGEWQESAITELKKIEPSNDEERAIIAAL